MIARHAGGILGGLLCSEWSSFTRSTETQRPGTLPSQNIPRLVGNSHNCVVERSLDVGNAVRDVLPLLFLKRLLLALFIRRRCSGSRCRWCCWFCHKLFQSSVFSLRSSASPCLPSPGFPTTEDRRLPSRFWLPISSWLPRCPCADLYGCARWCGCVVHGPAGSADDDSRDRNRFR